MLNKSEKKALAGFLLIVCAVIIGVAFTEGMHTYILASDWELLQELMFPVDAVHAFMFVVICILSAVAVVLAFRKLNAD